MSYLESLIATGETKALFHNELIELYLTEVMKLIDAQPKSPATEPATGAASAIRPKASPRSAGRRNPSNAM